MLLYVLFSDYKRKTMKALFKSLCFLFASQVVTVNAQGILRGGPLFRNGGYWEFGYQQLFQPVSSGSFYEGKHQPAFAPPLRTEFTRSMSQVQRSYFRSTAKINDQWFNFFQMDMALHSFSFGSREYAPDGSIYRMNHYRSALEQYVQMGVYFGALYKKPINDRWLWRAGAHGGMLLSLFEKSWNPESPFLNGFNSSVRPTLGLEAAVEWQVSPKHNNFYLIGGYAFNHAFRVNEQTLSQGLATHHGLQLGLRIGLRSRKLAERRSDVVGF